VVRKINIAGAVVGGDTPPLIIAGPCVIESEEIAFDTARRLKEICSAVGLHLIFKSSYDKANRTSLESFRGPRIERGLRILADVRAKFDIPVISDVHSLHEIKPASEVLDALQIPAFLCRQTDLILAASETGKPVNIKKGQSSPPGMQKISLKNSPLPAIIISL